MQATFIKTWRLPFSLVLLGLLPIAASLYRVIMMAGTDPSAITDPDEARFFAMPIPILLHVIFGSLFLILGALQMSATVRMRFKGLHRKVGWVALTSGIVFSLAGVWMVFVYPSHSMASLGIDIARVVFGMAIVGFIVAGVRAALRKDFKTHRAWMIRGYALAASSGLQSYLIGLAVAINGGFDNQLANAMMWIGWIVGIIAAELIISGRPKMILRRKLPKNA